MKNAHLPTNLRQNWSKQKEPFLLSSQQKYIFLIVLIRVQWNGKSHSLLVMSVRLSGEQSEVSQEATKMFISFDLVILLPGICHQ